MDLSRLFSFFTNSWNHSEQEPANLPLQTSSRDPYLEKLCASHSSGTEAESSGNPERTSNGHLERFCKDCKFYSQNPYLNQYGQLSQLGSTKPIVPEHGCSEGTFRNLITGERQLRDCTIRRNSYASHDECGPEGKKWEPKP